MVAIGAFHARGKKIKFARGSRIIGKQVSPAEYRGRIGTVIEYLGSSQYRIGFDDAGRRHNLVDTQWLELFGEPL